MALSKLLADEGYHNYVKSDLALHYVKKGIQSIVETQAIAFHRNAIGPSHRNCHNKCASSMVYWHEKYARLKIDCSYCDRWLQNIIRSLPKTVSSNLNCENSNPHQWPTKAFEVCKLFMPVGCQHKQSFKEADIHSMLTLIKKCTPFIQCGRFGKMDLVDELLDIRNSLAHSGDNEVDRATLQKYLQTAIVFLKGLQPVTQSEKDAVQESLDRINELETCTLDKEQVRQALQKVNATEMEGLNYETNENKEHTHH